MYREPQTTGKRTGRRFRPIDNHRHLHRRVGTLNSPYRSQRSPVWNLAFVKMDASPFTPMATARCSDAYFFGLEHRLKHPDGGLSAVRPIARQVREISACLPVGNRREGGQNEIWTKEPRCVWQFGAGTVYNIDIWKSQRVSGFFPALLRVPGPKSCFNQSLDR